MSSEGINSATKIRKDNKQQRPLSPKEKILLEKRLDYVPSSSHKGPDLGLFFHELVGNETYPKRIFDLLGGVIGILLFLATFPLFALVTALFSRGQILRTDTCYGLRGTSFIRYCYNVYRSPEKQTKGLVGKLLYKTRIYRLPNFINFARGEMALVGPSALPEKVGRQLNGELTDFYKRYAVKPGIIGIGNGRRPAEKIRDHSDWEHVLQKELYYVAKPTLKKDIKVVLGKLEQGSEPGD